MAFTRDWSDVQKAKEKYLNQETKSEVTGLPPGFIAGGELDIDDNRVRVAPFIAHVSGKRIQVDVFTYQNTMTKAVDIEVGYYYHIYLDKNGQFYIDIIPPEVSEQYYGYYHPAVEWRYLGSFLEGTDGPERLISSNRSEIEDFIIDTLYDFNNDDKLTPGEKYQVKKEWDIIVATHPKVLTQAAAAGVDNTDLVAKYTALNNYLNTDPDPLDDLTTTTDINGETIRTRFSEYYEERENVYDSINDLLTRPVIVTVGSSSYTGIADYNCDGTNDEVQIKAAIDFLASTYGGGEIQLTYGTYNIEADIDRSFDTGFITIEGQGLNTILNFDGGDFRSWSGESIRNCKIKITAPGSTYRGLLLGLGENSSLISCYIEDVYSTDDGNTMIISGRGASIMDCVFDGSTGIRINGSSSLITNCVFKDYKYNFAVWATGDNIVISNNTFQSSEKYVRELSDIPAGANQCIYVTGDGCSVTGNTFNKAASIRHTIRIGGDNTVVSNNNSIDSESIFIYVDPDSKNNIISGNNAKNRSIILSSSFEDVTAPGFGGSSTVTNATFARTTEWAYFSDYSFKMTQLSGAADSTVYFQDSISTTDMHDYQAGQSYNIEIAFKDGNTPSACNMVIDEYVGGSWVNLGTLDLMASGNALFPVPLTSDVTVSARATAVRAGIVIPSGNASKYVYVDRLRIWQASKDNFSMSHLRNFSETTQQIGNSWNGIDGRVQSYVDIDISASDYVINFDDILVRTAIYGAAPIQTANIGYKFRVSWYGGDGSNNLTFSSTSTWNINNISEANYQADGTGGLDFTVVADGELIATAAGGGEIWDSDGGNFTYHFEKFTTGQMVQYGTNSIGPLSPALTNNNIGTYGWSFYAGNTTISFPIEFAVVPTVTGSGYGGIFNVQTLTTTSFAASMYSHVDIFTGVRDLYFDAKGRWTTAYPRVS